MSTSNYGPLIAIEGIDGSGKTRFIDALRSVYNDKVIYTKEPYDYKTLKEEVMFSDMSPNTKAMLFTVDRLKHLKELEPCLSRGETVIMDRYFWTTFAYQGAQGAEYMPMNAMSDDVIVPDLVILFLGNPLKFIARSEDSFTKDQENTVLMAYDKYQQRELRYFGAKRTIYVDLSLGYDPVQDLNFWIALFESMKPISSKILYKNFLNNLWYRRPAEYRYQNPNMFFFCKESTDEVLLTFSSDDLRNISYSHRLELLKKINAPY